MYDLRNQWLSDDRQVRLITSMAIFWDQAQVGEMVDEEIEIQKLELQQARLRWRGYSTPFMNPEGTLELYHYLPSLGYWPWQRHRGHYSQHGRADTLVSKPDGRLLVAAHGDELQMDFKSAGAPDTVRQFVFHAVGLGKDYDPNTQAHTTVGPIPAQQFGSRDEDGIPISTEQERCRYFEISLPRTTR
jgi:hypothetical protein